MPIVLIRSAVASFQARGDTTTPMLVSLAAIAINVGLKTGALSDLWRGRHRFGHRVGAWSILAASSYWRCAGDGCARTWVWPKSPPPPLCERLAALAVVLSEAPALVFADDLAHLRNEAQLASHGRAGGLVYAAVLLVSLAALGVRLRRRGG